MNYDYKKLNNLNMKIKILTIFFFATFATIFSCSKVQKTNNQAIANFEAEKYLGNWYEIARYDHSFEKNCENVVANYSKKGKKIQVLNSCVKNGVLKSAKAIAYFKENPQIAHLKVSFFRPFYGDYKVIYIDEDYENAIIDGGTYNYFWILSRNKKLQDKKLNFLLQKAKEFGYEKEKMIFTKQN